MNILITGGTGFIGSALCARLMKDGHNLVVVSRAPGRVNSESETGQIKGINDPGQLTGNEQFDVVINLAGEPIADKRWSEGQKQRIISSRLDTTDSLIRYFNNAEHKPRLFISGSAIGYYGVGVTDEAVDEAGARDESFSSRLCQQWENLALQAQALGIRTCLLRTGIVLGKGGGALQKMLLPFKLGAGGIIGTGNQWMPWIHLDDLVGTIIYCFDHEGLSGPINGTAPNPVTNRVFTKALGKTLKRPTFLPMPAAAVKLMIGQMGEELLLSGKRVLPDKVMKAGYRFRYEQLDGALLNILNEP